jgi:hypothetical protein
MNELVNQLGENLTQMLGLAPFKPPPQFDPQGISQSEFAEDSDEQFVQDWLVAHNSRWRLAQINDEAHYMMLYDRTEPTHFEFWGF